MSGNPSLSSGTRKYFSIYDIESDSFITGPERNVETNFPQCAISNYFDDPYLYVYGVYSIERINLTNIESFATNGNSWETLSVSGWSGHGDTNPRGTTVAFGKYIFYRDFYNSDDIYYLDVSINTFGVLTDAYAESIGAGDGMVLHDSIVFMIAGDGSNTLWRTVNNFPTLEPTPTPTEVPSHNPSQYPTTNPTQSPTNAHSNEPSIAPSNYPTDTPTQPPTQTPTVEPSAGPSSQPTAAPSGSPSLNPTVTPSVTPSTSPTTSPSITPSTVPSQTPSITPTGLPTNMPTIASTLIQIYNQTVNASVC